MGKNVLKVAWHMTLRTTLLVLKIYNHTITV